jgi:hypothetical protein
MQLGYFQVIAEPVSTRDQLHHRRMELVLVAHRGSAPF